MDSEVLEVLKEIRDGVKATNGRLDETNARLGSLEQRVESGLTSLGERIDETNTRLETVDGRLRFVEKRLKDGFDELSGKIDTVAARQLEAEARTTAEIVAVGEIIMKVAQNYGTRISALERQR